MGRRGPPRDPTVLRLIKGRTNHRTPINRAEPKYNESLEMPTELKKFPAAIKEWNRRIDELLEWGVINKQDANEFADYCCKHAIYLDLLKKIKKMGYELAIAKGFYKAFQSASSQRLRLGSKFGFTPSDRTMIVAKPKDKEK